MTMFDISFDRTIGHEGGYQADPKDRGNWTTGVIGKGELKGTKYGISAMTYPNVDIKNLTVDQAKAIYKKDFWDKPGIERFQTVIQFQLFDAAINHGWATTVKMLQRAAGVKDDGIVGPMTIEAVNNTFAPSDIVAYFLAERIEYFTKLSTFQTYGKGWMVRCANNLRLATQDN
jgi:lysozyme family protein